MGLNVQVGSISSPGGTGNQTYDLPDDFDPKALIVTASKQTDESGGSAHMTQCQGFATDRGGTGVMVYVCAASEDNIGTADTYGGHGTNAILKLHDGTTVGIDVEVDFVEFLSGASSAFVLNWVNLPGSTIDVQYMVLGGDAIEDALAGTFGSSTTTGAQDVTVTAGFGHPDLVLFMSNGDPTSQDDANAMAMSCFGFAKRGESGRCILTHSQDAAATQATTQAVRNASCIFTHGWTGTGTELLGNMAAEVGWPTDGFELNWTTVQASARQVRYLALRFSADVTVTTGEGAMPTSPGNQTLASADTPKFAYLLHTRQTTANSLDSSSTDAMLGGVGAIDGDGNERWNGWSDDDGQATASVCGTYQSSSKALRTYLPSSNALDGEADGVVNGTDFELQFTDAPPSAFLYEWFTLGVVEAAPAAVLPSLVMAPVGRR